MCIALLAINGFVAGDTYVVNYDMFDDRWWQLKLYALWKSIRVQADGNEVCMCNVQGGKLNFHTGFMIGRLFHM